jgi:wyosine [tRNA(Phe)-imidazoG37] synthetase (radical SAM superfamily)
MIADVVVISSMNENIHKYKKLYLYTEIKRLLFMLFNEIIFGPIKSRRLGTSLGINVLPIQTKYCTFDCIYCECGWTHADQEEKAKLFTRNQIREAMEKRFPELLEQNMIPDSITFAGNGEPTIHPDLLGITEDTIALRDKYFPKAKLTILSNASLINRPHIKEALYKFDNRILKLDAGSEEMFNRINRPVKKSIFNEILNELISFDGNLIIQTLFFKGTYEGKVIDNTSIEEIELWLNHLKKINPRYVMLYGLDRETPAKELVKLSKKEIDLIAEKVRAIGIKAEVYT